MFRPQRSRIDAGAAGREVADGQDRGGHGRQRGIGYAIAEAFRRLDDDVTITGRDAARLAAAGDRLGARGVVADAADPGALEALGCARADGGGGVDVLVNNAGGFVGRAPADGTLADLAEHWVDTLRANLLGAVLTVAALEPHLRPGAAVVSIGSIGAEYAANPYSTAKAALAAWNVGLAERLGPRDVTANVVAPGFVDGTDLFGGRMADDRRRGLIDRTHLGRAGRPEDVAEVVTFLASAGARNVTGQTWHVNGGAFTTR